MSCLEFKEKQSSLVIIGTKVFDRSSGIELGTFIKEIYPVELERIRRGDIQIPPGQSILHDRGSNRNYLIKSKSFKELLLTDNGAKILKRNIDVYDGKSLGKILFSSLITNRDYHEAIKIVRKNTKGKIWLVGGTVSRTLINTLYGGAEKYAEAILNALKNRNV